MVIIGTVVKHWSRKRATRFLRSEYYAIVMRTAEWLGIQSLLSNLELKAEVRMRTESNAAKAVSSKCGLGKTGDTLWVQEMTNSGRVKTKGKAWHEIEKLFRGVGED